jgi:RNA polymerase sigma-32 factor
MAQRKLFFNLTKAKAKYKARGIDISDEELAAELGVKPKELRDMEQRLFSPTVRLDMPSDSVGGKSVRQNRHGNFIERTRPDIIEDGHGPSELLEKMELKRTMDDLIPRFMNGLSDRDQIVFQRRLIQYDSDTLDSIGVDLQLTRERIRQIESQLKGKFKRFLQSNRVSNVA